jgi:hypothetical protein
MSSDVVARLRRLFCIVATLVSFCEHLVALQPCPRRRLTGTQRQISLQPSDKYFLFASPDGISSEDRSGKSKSINEVLSELGVSFKSKAKETGLRAKEASTKKAKILNLLMSSMCYLLFFVYRAYRGFFVILPAVFKRVYAKLETAVEDYALEERDEAPAPTETVSWKTRLTVGICAIVVTGSFAMGGSIILIKTFVRAVLNTKSLPDSFDAVADVIESQGDEVKSKTPPSSADGLLP